VTSFLFVFFGFFNKGTANTPGRIFTQNASNDVVPGKEVPFGGPDDYILIRGQKIVTSGFGGPPMHRSRDTAHAQ